MSTPPLLGTDQYTPVAVGYVFRILNTFCVYHWHVYPHWSKIRCPDWVSCKCGSIISLVQTNSIGMEFICTFELKQDKSDIQKNEKEMSSIWHNIVMLVPLYSPAKHYDTRLFPWKPESSLSLPSLISLLLLLLLALISAPFLIINWYHFNTYFLTIFFFSVQWYSQCDILVEAICCWVGGLRVRQHNPKTWCKKGQGLPFLGEVSVFQKRHP